MNYNFPVHRIYDEKKLVICSQEPENLIRNLERYNFEVQYILYCNGMRGRITRPVLYPETLMDQFPNSRVLLDENVEEAREYLERLSGGKTELMTIRDFCGRYPDRPFACTKDNLYIELHGDVYQCPCILDRPAICNIEEDDALEKLSAFSLDACVCKRGYAVRAEEPLRIRKVSLEFGGPCQLSCVYCYEMPKVASKKRIISLNKLDRFLSGLSFERMCVAGGEVMIQDDVLSYLETFHKKHPEVILELKMNGFSDRSELAARLFRKVTVSFCAFSEKTVNLVAGPVVPLEIAKDFCRKLSANPDIKLEVKLVLTPLVVPDAADFLSWGLEIGADEISFTKAMLFGSNRDDSWSGSAFYGLNRAYWGKIFMKSGLKFREILLANIDRIREKRLVRMGQYTDVLLQVKDIMLR